MVAKGARRGKAQQRRLLQPFTPLLLSYIGRGELRTLTAVEEAAAMRRLSGERLACGLYLNELLINLLPKEVASEDLFVFYSDAVDALATGQAINPLLRKFELNLLEAMGVAPSWGRDCVSGEMVDAGSQYSLSIEGPTLSPSDTADRALFDGQTLLALAAGETDQAEFRAQVKSILRYFINFYLNGRTLKSRELLRGPAKKRDAV